MLRHARLALLVVSASLVALLCASCIEAPYVGTASPSDAKFTLSCIGGCGLEGRDAGMLLEVSFSGGGRDWSRQYALCCNQREELRSWLQTYRDHYCEGLPVPKRKVGELILGGTISEETGKRGVTIDDGEGYVAFNCGEWLEQLIDKLAKTDCCDAKHRPRQRKKR